MGSLDSSDWEEEQRGSPCISKRLRIPKKVSDDFIRVDYALVPRKLRSVKKRSSGLVSSKLLISKKHKLVENGDKLWGKNGLKKLKPSTEQGISARPGRHVFGGAITKDEEEVAETLYALADMFPETTKDMTGEPSKLEEAFPNMEMSGSGAKVIPEKAEESAEGVKIQSPSDGSWFESLVKKSSLELDAQEPKLLSTNGEAGSNEATGENPGKALALAAFDRGQHQLPHSLRENTSDGLTLRKSLHSEMQCVTHASNFSRSSTSKNPIISPPQSFENSGTLKKVASKKPWKKSCTHVHISNLIVELKKADTLQMQSTQTAHFVELNRGAFASSNTSNENTNKVFPFISTSDPAQTSSNEIRNAVLLHKRLLEDQQHAVSASQFFTYLQSKNQQAIPFLLPPNYYPSNYSTGGGTAVEHWKAGRISESNTPSLVHFAPFFTPSHSSLGVFGQDYAPRQPGTMPPLLLPPSREQGQGHLHYGFQGSGGCHPDTVQPALQLLCNQQS